MFKKIVAFIFVMFSAISCNIVSATNFANDIGQWQFDYYGKYSDSRQTQLENINSKQNQTENNVLIKNTENVPVSSQINAKAEQKVSTQNAVNVDMPPSRVNSSKTMYTDEIGRLHFFRKANIIKE